jgi:hypothetical protein
MHSIIVIIISIVMDIFGKQKLSHTKRPAIFLIIKQSYTIELSVSFILVPI